MNNNNRRLAFDIETQANRHRLPLMPPPEVKLGNLKDPAKIAEKEREAAADQLERAALDPNFGRVVCISTAYRENVNATLLRPTLDKSAEVTMGQIVNTVTEIRRPGNNSAEDDLAEAELLRWFWNKASEFGLFATFNGACFDVPYLVRRSLLLGVRPIRIDCNLYRVAESTCEHLDVFKALSESETGGGSYKRNLHFYASLILNEAPTYGVGLDKASIGDEYDKGNFDLIRNVCGWDASATLRLAERISAGYC